jgi:uncharacterized protein (DUF1015 family)
MRLRRFRALRPVPAAAAAVAAPPYDVVTRAEAAALAAGNPLSFLHVGRADIDLPETVEPDDPRVYATARDNLRALVARGTLLRDPEPGLFVYRQVLDGRAQTGVVGCVHVDDYERGVIRRHERTRPDKEDDRTRHILTVGAHAEPVLLAYRDRPELAALAAAAMAAPPLYDLPRPDGVRHTLWRCPEPGPWEAAFAAVPAAYVADGHHRSAGALRAARERRAAGAGAGEHDWFPAVLFPAGELRLLPYHRVVADLGGLDPAEVLARLGALGRLGPAPAPTPPRPGSFCLYLAGRWWLLELAAERIPAGDPLAALDVALLHERVLGPVLGLGDPRTDKRVDFVGGIRGTAALAALVDGGAAALAVSMFPTTVEQLMAVADAGQVMPPKSTWFEPKLLSGLFVHELA